MIEFQIANERGDYQNIERPSECVADILVSGPVAIRVLADGICIYEDEAFTWTPVQEEEIVEALREVDCKVEGVTVDAGTAFVTGGCAPLANAVVRLLPDAHVVAVYDALDEDGEELETPHMIHAGVVLLDGQVLDIDGTSDMETWFGRWADLGLECSLATWEPGTAPFKGGDVQTADLFASALVLACARSAGLLKVSEQIEHVAP